MDSNHRRHKPAGLQPDPFGRSGTDPRPKMVAEVVPLSTVWTAFKDEFLAETGLQHERERHEQKENRRETKGQDAHHPDTCRRGRIDLVAVVDLETHVFPEPLTPSA